jgi:hypothetical protein
MRNSPIREMGIYADYRVIYGIRILHRNEDGSYHIQQEFAVHSSPTWKEEAKQALDLYEENPIKKIQVLYQCGTSYDKDIADDSCFIWTDNVRPCAELMQLLL